MIVTERQHKILANLTNVTARTKMSGNRGFFLCNNDISGTINSMIVKGLLTKTGDGKCLIITKAGTANLEAPTT